MERQRDPWNMIRSYAESTQFAVSDFLGALASRSRGSGGADDYSVQSAAERAADLAENLARVVRGFGTAKHKHGRY